MKRIVALIIKTIDIKTKAAPKASESETRWG
jgi:hypothetical protein